MANEILSTTTSLDQEKWLNSKLVRRSFLKLVAADLCEKVDQPKGTGQQGFFIRYKRMNVPLTSLSEGVTPSNSSFELEQFTSSLDQWGDYVILTDVAQLTTKHPLLQQAIELLADNAARVIDREIQIVWLAGTNVMYGDASVTSRAAITTSMKISDQMVQKARITLVDAGVAPKEGPASGMEDAKAASAKGNIMGKSAYVAVAGPQVLGDIMNQALATGAWINVAVYQEKQSIFNAEVGTYFGIRWVESNFIPKFSMLGNTTAAVTSGNAFGTNTPVVTAVDGGGSLTSATTYFFKVTRKSLQRGFEEDISIAHSMASAATGNNESFTFNFSGLTAGYVYNLYFGAAGADADLKLVQANIAVGTTVTVTAVPGSGANPPGNVNPTGTPVVHPIYYHGAEAVKWVGLQGLETKLSKPGASTHDPLDQRRTVGYKFMAKALILDQTRLLRHEVASTF